MTTAPMGVNAPVDLSQRPFYAGPERRELLFAQDWPVLDFSLMREHILRLVSLGGLRPSDFRRAGVTPETCAKMFRTQFSDIKPKILFRAYYIALRAVEARVALPGDIYRPDYLDERIGWMQANRELARSGPGADKAGVEVQANSEAVGSSEIGSEGGLRS